MKRCGNDKVEDISVKKTKTELHELASAQIILMGIFFRSCELASYGPSGNIDTTTGALTLPGYSPMSFTDYCMEYIRDPSPLVLHLGIWGAQEGKTDESHTGNVIQRIFGSDLRMLFLDILPFCVTRVKTFKQVRGDDCFLVNKMPPSVRSTWNECAMGACNLTRKFISLRAAFGHKTVMYGMGPGAMAWVEFSGLTGVVSGPHPSAIRGHPGPLKSIISAAQQVRSELDLGVAEDDMVEVSKLFKEHDIDEVLAKNGLACIMHLPVDIIKDVITLGAGMDKIALSKFIGMRWWTLKLVKKGYIVRTIFPALFQAAATCTSFWSSLDKFTDPTAGVQLIVNALTAAGLKDTTKILSIDSAWSALGKFTDPPTGVQLMVNALTAAGLKDSTKILSHSSSWSALCKFTDPAASVQLIVNALTAAGLKDATKILSHSSSWSALCKFADPAAGVQLIVNALTAAGLKDATKILSHGSPWSALGKFTDPAAGVQLIMNALNAAGLKDATKILSIDSSWSALGKFTDPADGVQLLVNALTAAGLKDATKILSICSSWSALGKFTDPVAGVQLMMNALTAAGLKDATKILSKGSSWSALGAQEDMNNFITHTVATVPEKCSAVFSITDCIWSRMKEFHLENPTLQFWPSKLTMVNTLGLPAQVMSTGYFWKTSGLLQKTYTKTIQRGICEDVITRTCKSLTIGTEGNGKRFNAFVIAMENL